MMPTAKLTECIVVFFVSYHSVAQNVYFFFSVPFSQRPLVSDLRLLLPSGPI